MRERRDIDDIDYPFQFAPVVPPHAPYTIALEDTFRKQGLQVIIDISSIELTPLDNLHANERWELPGQLNEHIVAIAFFAFEVENVTEPRIAFRQRTCLDGCFYHYNEENFTNGDHRKRDAAAHRYGKCGKESIAMARILGLPPSNVKIPDRDQQSYQTIGSVAMPQGRLVTFPNVIEHRIEPLRLVNERKPGYFRWLKVLLVDPYYRLCSTRNVPPQQHEWWAEAVSKDLALGGLVPEVIDQILQGTDNWPMGMKEAKRHRDALIKEHQWNERVKFNQSWKMIGLYI